MNHNRNCFPFMFCRRINGRTKSRSGWGDASDAAAFTLIEVMLAVFITGLIAMGIFRFMDSTLRSIRTSSEQSVESLSMRALMNVIQDQLNSLAVNQNGALLGEAHKFNDLSSDEMQWLCRAGNGLFTGHALGEYKVTLALKPTKIASVFELGVRRIISDESNKDDNWFGLMQNVKALEIRYYDRRLNAWLEKWTDQATRPKLVRMRIWRVNDEEAYEKIFSLPLSSN